MSTSQLLADLFATLVALHARVWQSLPELTVSWLFTYAVHSTLLIGAIWLVVTRLRPRSQLVRDTLWKVALVGTIVTTSWQVASGVRPVGGRLDLPSESATTELWGMETVGRLAYAVRQIWSDAPTAPVGHASGNPTQLATVPIDAVPISTVLIDAVPISTVPIDAVPVEAVSIETVSVEAVPVEFVPGGTPPGDADASWDRSAIWPQASDQRRESRTILLGARGDGWLARRSPAPRQSATSNLLPAPGAGASRIADVAAWLGRVWPQLVLIAWAAGGTLGLLRLAILWLCIHRRIGRRRRIASGPLPAILEELRRDAGLIQPIRLTCSQRISGPIALGMAEICVPERVLTDLDAGQQRGVLAHELAHLKRRDPLWLQINGLIGALLFFQPLNRLVTRQMREAAEYLCDDWAVQQTASRLSMAQSLAEVASWIETGPRPVPVTSMAERSSALVRRIQRVLVEQPAASSRLFVWLQAPLAALLVLALGLLAPGVSAIDLPWQREAGGARPAGVQRAAAATNRLVIRHATRDAVADGGLDETAEISGSLMPLIVIGPDSGVDEMPMLAASRAGEFGDIDEWTEPPRLVTTSGMPAWVDWSAHRDLEDIRADELGEEYAHQTERDDHARHADRRDRWEDENDWDERNTWGDQDGWEELDEQYDRSGDDSLESARRAYEHRLQRFEVMNERLSRRIAFRLEPRLDDLDDEIEEMLEPQLDQLEDELNEMLEPVLERIGERLEARIEQHLETTLEDQLPALLAVELSQLERELRHDQRIDGLDAVLELYVERIGERLEEALTDEIEEMIDTQLESLERDIEAQLERITR